MRNTKQNMDWSLLYGGDYTLTNWKEQTDGTTHLYLDSLLREVKCPHCGQMTRVVHTAYTRTIQEIPISGNKPTFLHVQLYKFRCENEDCEVKVFSETLPFVSRYQQRTDQLNCLVLSISTAMGNETAAKVLDDLGITISADSIDRLWKKIKIVEVSNVEAIGIDDVALRKGHEYATVIYDATDGHLLAVLPGRSKESVAEWLKAHSHIKMVARDRASAYAAAIREYLPHALQVADRFHLFQNILKYLNDLVREDLPKEGLWLKDGCIIDKDTPCERISRADQIVTDNPNLDYDDSAPLDDTGATIAVDFHLHENTRPEASQQQAAQKRQQKHALVLEVKRLRHQEKLRIKDIVDRLGLSPATVGKYAKMSAEEVEKLLDPALRRPRANKGQGCANMIFKMMADAHPDDVIFSYVQAHHSDISNGTIINAMRAVQSNHFPERKDPFWKGLLALSVKKIPVGAAKVSRRKLSAYIFTQDPAKRTNESIEAALPAIRERFDKLVFAETAFDEFHSVIMGDDVSALDSFLNKYRVGPLASFVIGIENDIEAVRNAIRYDMSSGFVEGGNNKFKLIKRLGYGRNDLPSLSKKARVSFLISKTDTDVYSLVKYPSRRLIQVA